MRIKPILSVAAFITAFIFSSVFASLFVVQSDGAADEVTVMVSEPAISRHNCRTKQQMLDFLEQDRRYGRELANDMAGSEIRNASRNIEETATLNLVRKMRRMDDSAMPSDFRQSWEAHVRAWEDQADFIHESNNRSRDENFGEGYGKRNGEISRTYYDLLEVAQQYGVDFPN